MTVVMLCIETAVKFLSLKWWGGKDSSNYAECELLLLHIVLCWGAFARAFAHPHWTPCNTNRSAREKLRHLCFTTSEKVLHDRQRNRVEAPADYSGGCLHRVPEKNQPHSGPSENRSY